MEKVIIDFVNTELVSVLTTMIGENIPHSAAMHFSYSEKYNAFYFSLDRTSRKAGFLNQTHTTNGALVIGVNNVNWKTLQMEGVVQIVTEDEELAEVKKIHYSKNPGSKEFESDEDTIFLVFKADWYRYTDETKDPIEKIEWEAEG